MLKECVQAGTPESGDMTVTLSPLPFDKGYDRSGGAFLITVSKVSS